MRESLRELGVRHGTDKAVPRRDLLWHYERFLAHLREDEAVVVEIGIFGGASLRMWRDYFPSGRIIGVDINPECAQHAEDRISVCIGSAEDTAFLDEVLAESGPPDVVIDDGSHRVRHQIGTLQHLWPHLKPGGLYIVEDIHTSYLPDYNMRWREPGTTVELLKGVVDDMHALFHDRPVQLLQDCVMVNFVPEACLLLKQA